jgi:hypothetical protein
MRMHFTSLFMSSSSIVIGPGCSAGQFPDWTIHNSYNRSCLRKLGILVPSGSIKRMYVDPQGRRRPPGRVLEKKKFTRK